MSVPQPEQLEPVRASPDAAQKRRQSSVSENGNKRRRISGDQHGDEHPLDETRPQPAVAQEVNTTRPSRKAVTATEERKRGQRLFGGLLGTLSQTSSTAAQRRRADIEQRQQAKLKQQDEQQSEAKRLKKEELEAERRKQEKHLQASSVCPHFRSCTS